MAPPRRTVAARPSRRELLIFAEGEVTEEDYLKYWHRRFRKQVNVEIHEFHGTPLALVERAVEAKTANERTARRGRGRAHDEVWCIFDIDAHPRLDEARNLASTHGINLAISNPCIELWFLLHFTEQTAYIDRHIAQKEAKTHLKCSKALSDVALTLLAENFDVAKGRAQRLDEKHLGDGTPAPGNPSSSVWRVVDSITQLP
ncbi:MAG TPA: RloB family protein [Solirubrobacterales bacterium]|nr:RloB family protein [Solirubrobacterales bacterium]